MAWMRMPGQTWLDAARSFIAMWTVMMIAMMSPSLVAMLHRYRLALGGASVARAGRLMATVSAGYFLVWTLLGAIVFPLGAATVAAAMGSTTLARAVPTAVAVVVLLAGVFQLGEWKAHLLGCWREPHQRGDARAENSISGLRHGVRLGLDCCYCCAGLTACALVLGVMDLRVMAAVTLAATAERVAPDGVRVARMIGAIGVVAGVVLIARAIGPALWA